jgi:DNA-binding NarL/FixJ family response regulator
MVKEQTAEDRVVVADRVRIKVQIVEDHEIVAKAFKDLIDESNEAVTTGVFYDIASFRRSLLTSQPDVVLLDKSFPKGGADDNGIDFCVELRKKYPALKIIILTVSNSYADITHSFANGALGYIIKSTSEEELIAGIEAVNAGEQFLCKDSQSLVRKHAGEKEPVLSDSDLLVLLLLANGHTEQEIGDHIFRSHLTVKWRMSLLREKLDAKNGPNLVAIAFRKGLIA